MAAQPVVVGITCDFETFTCRRGAQMGRFTAPEATVRAVQDAGGCAVLLPHPTAVEAPATAARLVGQIDALIVSGGDFDVPPSAYGQAPHPRLGRLLPERSDFERAILQAALALQKPVLGICGGMQLLNVVFGGTLHQDLSLRPNTAVHEQPQQKHLPQHDIALQPGSALEAAYQQPTLPVNSTHHQVVDRLGQDLVATGHSPDGVIEALEHRGYAFCVGVQWHPEAMPAQPHWQIFHALVGASASRKGAQSSEPQKSYPESSYSESEG